MVASIGGKDVELLTSLSGQASWAANEQQRDLVGDRIWRGEKRHRRRRLAQAAGAVCRRCGADYVFVQAAPASFSFDGTASMSENAFSTVRRSSRPFAQAVLEWSQATLRGAAIVRSRFRARSRRRPVASNRKHRGGARQQPGMGALDFSSAKRCR